MTDILIFHYLHNITLIYNIFTSSTKCYPLLTDIITLELPQNRLLRPLPFNATAHYRNIHGDVVIKNCAQFSGDIRVLAYCGVD